MAYSVGGCHAEVMRQSIKPEAILQRSSRGSSILFENLLIITCVHVLFRIFFLVSLDPKIELKTPKLYVRDGQLSHRYVGQYLEASVDHNCND